MFDLKKTLRFLPIHVIHPKSDYESALRSAEELESLVITLGGVIVERVIQKLEKPNNATFIGSGKVDEVASLILQHHVNVVVLNKAVKPRQIHTLKLHFQKVKSDIEVWDRVDLILYIFDKHATTQEAKLQIELARMNYMGPRIYGMGFVLSRQGGGIGTLGIGETNTELMKRHWRDEKKRITDQLEKIMKNHEQQLERRRRGGFKTVSIVGYTNAGKSSLFNALTGKEMLVANELFATLDSSVGKLYLDDLGAEVLVTDTIGFIRDLPPQLIKAFTSTLMESIQADLLLHVIDSSDPEAEVKIHVVNDILRELGRYSSDTVYVFNKTDSASENLLAGFRSTYQEHNPLFVSVKTGNGIDSLKKRVAQIFLEMRTS